MRSLGCYRFCDHEGSGVRDVDMTTELGRALDGYGFPTSILTYIGSYWSFKVWRSSRSR